MHCTQKITGNIHWIGGEDRRIALFENMFPLPDGVSYNSYFIDDEKTVVLDTVDSAITRRFLENIGHLLNGRKLDYLILNHMEPDHCSSIDEILVRYPDVTLVGNKKTFQILKQFYPLSANINLLEVSEGDELHTGNHVLTFAFAPMVHWPEVMVTYEKTNGVLFSADAIGSFGAFSGNLFADQVDFENTYLDEYRRYYANIVGKYGLQVQSAIKKLTNFEIKIICPLHGFVWRENIDYIMEKYNLWSAYTPEKNGVVLFYASMYGNTENAVSIIASKLSEKGITDLKVYDVSKTHPSYIISEVFKYSHMVVASPTYNNGLYFIMESLLHEMAALNVQNRKAAVVGNGSWAPVAHKSLISILSNMKNVEIISEPLVILSSLTEDQLTDIDKMVDEIVRSAAKN